ncbi:hypothetical protein J6590_008884 [Homalodisca vitripennis]|nr:hypothetical protein J6590_008884 [Homalodisca vitripennis]
MVVARARGSVMMRLSNFELSLPFARNYRLPMAAASNVPMKHFIVLETFEAEPTLEASGIFSVQNWAPRRA